MIKFEELIKKMESNQCDNHEVSRFLGFPRLNRKEFLVFSKALMNNQSLTIIDLQHYNFGTEVAKAIAEALKHNQSLTSIELGSNNLRSEAIKAIAEALKYNQCLTSIRLDYNRCGSEAAQAIAEALKYNQCLANIDLYNNDLDPKDAKTITEALKHNLCLTRLNLGMNNLGPEEDKIIAEIKQLLNRNKLVKTKTRLAFLSFFNVKYHETSPLSKMPKPKEIGLSRSFTELVFVYAGCNSKPFKSQIKKVFQQPKAVESGNKNEPVEKKIKHDQNVQNKNIKHLDDEEITSRSKQANSALLSQFNQQLTEMSSSLDSFSQYLNSNNVNANGKSNNDDGNANNNNADSQSEEYTKFVEQQHLEYEQYKK